MKKIAILGSTGSIGTQTVDILPSIEAEVVALTTNRRIGLLEEQARALHPKMVCAFDENAAKELRVKLADTDIEVLTGMDGLIACASESGADIVVTAVVGMVGLLPTLAAINAGKDIALANKETLVCAGGIVMEAARETGSADAAGRQHDARAGACAPELVDGREDHHRLRDHDEQGTGADRGDVAV